MEQVRCHESLSEAWGNNGGDITKQEEWRYEVESNLHTVDRAMTEFLQAEGTHDHPIHRHQGAACSKLRFAETSRFVFVISTVTFAGRPHHSDQKQQNQDVEHS